MVADPRTSVGAHALRRLNEPVDIRVQTDASGQPVALRRPGWPAGRQVASVQDTWRIDDEWWREHPISRHYYSLILDDGRLLTVYHDLPGDRWFEQRG